MSKHRFYKANLPTVIWNPKTSSALAEFVNGQFVTDDDRVALILVKKGYPEIPLDATSPPNCLAEKGTSLKNDVPLMPADYGEASALNKAKVKAALVKSKEAGEKPKKALRRKIVRRKKK